jgi:flavin reductase (DIM6/NTAB) family NADH-FMN oxidoreductase RutF
MKIDLSEKSGPEIYHLLTQTIVPRPIAWILSGNKEGSDEPYNLAPFSFFNAMASAPPTLVVSIGKKPSGDEKDTRANLAEGELCVVHIPQVAQMQAVSDSSKTLEYGDSELKYSQLNSCEFEGFDLPRLTDCPIAFGCKVAKVIEWGPAPQALILLEIRHAYIDDNICTHDDKGRVRIDAKKLNPLARLGANEYAELGDILQLARPD